MSGIVSHRNEADIRAEQRRSRTVSVEVHVSCYEIADVPMRKIPTEDLVAELRDRERDGEKFTSDGELEEGYAMFTLDVSELWAIRHLYLVGREAEASDKARRLLADMLGTAI